MFYILVSIGIILIVIGISSYKSEEYNNKDNNSAEEVEVDYFIIQEIEDLKYRIENLEKQPTSTDLSFSSVENYKKVLQYEKEDHSIEEISDLLNMKKGEVLLLKNLYKNYED